MQALLNFVVNSPVAFITLYSKEEIAIGTLDYAGIALFMIGFTFSAWADGSLSSFLVQRGQGTLPQLCR